ncbi:Rhomboid protein 1 like [Verticillium longisporum]|nr:Rhomboid protein 1 like [Verticillium longisporum]
MTHFERLLPATTLVVLVVAALAGFAAVYTPPAQHDRLFPEASLATATVGTLIAINALVFLAWRVPPLWRLMNRYFLLVHGLPRPASLVLASFSHSSFLTHFLPNMAALWVLGTLLHDDVGRAALVALYVASGAAGFLGSLYWLTLRGHLLFSSLGASGAGLAFLGLVVGVHVFAFLRPRTTVDLMSHMAGMAAGILGASLARGAKQPAASASASDMQRVDLVRDVRVTTTSAGDKGGRSAGL